MQLQERLQPLVGALLDVGERRAVVVVGVVRFVEPVRGHTGFGDFVHVAGADLQLYRGAVGAKQGRMQRLVAIGLGDGDVVLEFAGEGLVEGV